MNKKKDIQCLNCGLFGHTCRLCNSPTTSYGVICFRIYNNEIQYIMIQRKDTLCYVEFVRGNYHIGNKNYIVKLFDRMTQYEKDFISNNNFETIWRDLWTDNKKNNVLIKNTKSKFDMLSSGYNIIQKNDDVYTFSLTHVLNLSKECLKEQEWEFPKGRRKLGEKDFQCGLREFSEESNIKKIDVNLIDNTKYFEEVYLSINKTRYRNIFFLGKYNQSNNLEHFDKDNRNQAKEVRDVKWLSYEDVCKKLNDRNKEKYEMFKIVHESVKKYIKNTKIR